MINRVVRVLVTQDGYHRFRLGERATSFKWLPPIFLGATILSRTIEAPIFFRFCSELFDEVCPCDEIPIAGEFTAVSWGPYAWFAERYGNCDTRSYSVEKGQAQAIEQNYVTGLIRDAETSLAILGKTMEPIAPGTFTGDGRVTIRDEEPAPIKFREFL